MIQNLEKSKIWNRRDPRIPDFELCTVQLNESAIYCGHRFVFFLQENYGFIFFVILEIIHLVKTFIYFYLRL